ncbi:MAG TPA: MauE/DoxX family redox-associated membrane protein [Moheibacter sp.]|nr:MauE/DoxX family redox-associated membrane protein [Moheibacter sp.]
MILSTSTKNSIINLISYLYILLFVYASVSKLLDFENFQIQLGQSPLLSAYAGPISFMVIFIELLLAAALIFDRTKLIGLYGSFSLMVAFSIYIYLILNYSDFVPCSCGGVLEKLGWTEHLVFNLAFVGLGACAIWTIENCKNSNKISIFSKLILLATLSSAVVMVLFFSSEHIIKKENPFIRSFPPHIIEFEKQIELKNNSYYFAGLTDSVIFLGNYLSPLNALELHNSFHKLKEIRLEPEESNFKFRAVQLRVFTPNFFLFDGSVPCFYVGEIENKRAKLKVEDEPYFTIAEPIDENTIVFRSNKSETGENVLGSLDLKSPKGFKLFENLLIAQNENDGIFDTDGFLLVDNHSRNFVYTYRYRNQFSVVNHNGRLIYQGNTIDTVSIAKIKIVRTSKGLEMKTTPTAVNLNGAVFKNHLFIHSALRGKYDDKKTWGMSATIDVYDVKKGIYLFSFYLTGLNEKKLSQFVVSEGNLYALFGSQIMKYRISGLLKESLLTY